MKKFEYKREKVPAEQFVEIMNELGKVGWELIVYSGGYAFLKKEIQFIITKDEKQLLQESYQHED